MVLLRGVAVGAHVVLAWSGNRLSTSKVGWLPSCSSYVYRAVAQHGLRIEGGSWLLSTHRIDQQC